MHKFAGWCLTRWRRQWHPTPVLLPRQSHGRRSLVGCSPWGRQSRTQLSDFTLLFTFMHWRRKWQPTPVFQPGESQRWGSLVGCRLWGRTESDTTEATQQQQQQQSHKTQTIKTSRRELLSIHLIILRLLELDLIRWNFKTFIIHGKLNIYKVIIPPCYTTFCYAEIPPA